MFIYCKLTNATQFASKSDTNVNVD